MIWMDGAEKTLNIEIISVMLLTGTIAMSSEIKKIDHLSQKHAFASLQIWCDLSVLTTEPKDKGVPSKVMSLG